MNLEQLMNDFSFGSVADIKDFKTDIDGIDQEKMDEFCKEVSMQGERQEKLNLYNDLISFT